MKSRSSSTKTVKSTTPTSKDECAQYTKYQSLLILLMLVFVGIICLPSMLQQISLKKKTGTIQKVYSSNPSFTVVDIRVGNTTFRERQIEQKVKEKDTVVVYANKNQLTHKKPSPLCIWLVIIYFLLLTAVLVFTVWVFWRF